MVRRGTPLRQVAEDFRVAPSTVLFWAQRAGTARLDRVEWTDRPRGPRTPANRYPRAVEDVVLRVRGALKGTSDLGEFGAQAIHAALQERGVAVLPSVRTIGRILDRRGALDSRYRVRRPAPPRDGICPTSPRGGGVGQLRHHRGPGDSGRHARRGPHGALPARQPGAAWPRAAITAPVVVDTLTAHWREVGLPAYAQFDNDPCFQGAHVHPDTLGQVPRLCLSLGVVPVFVPRGNPASRPPSRTSMAGGRRKSGRASSTRPALACSASRSSTSPPAAGRPLHGSRMPHPGARSPRGGASIPASTHRDGSSSCGAPTTTGRSPSWDIRFPWTPPGATASSARRSIWRLTGSGSTRSAAGNRRGSLSWGVFPTSSLIGGSRGQPELFDKCCHLSLVSL